MMFLDNREYVVPVERRISIQRMRQICDALDIHFDNKCRASGIHYEKTEVPQIWGIIHERLCYFFFTVLEYEDGSRKAKLTCHPRKSETAQKYLSSGRPPKEGKVINYFAFQAVNLHRSQSIADYIASNLISDLSIEIEQ
jgi:hypothetical protein